MDNTYKKLDAYTMAKELVRMVYGATKQFPDEEKFVLCNQIRRAAISVPSNIAEGLSRSAVKEQCHFLDIAFGSLMETDCQLEIARDLNYISNIFFLFPFASEFIFLFIFETSEQNLILSL